MCLVSDMRQGDDNSLPIYVFDDTLGMSFIGFGNKLITKYWSTISNSIPARHEKMSLSRQIRCDFSLGASYYQNDCQQAQG